MRKSKCADSIKSKEDDYGRRYIFERGRLIKTSVLGLSVTLFSFTQTCYASEHVGAISQERALLSHTALVSPSSSSLLQTTLFEQPTVPLFFKVSGICCCSEVSILKNALQPLLNMDGREANCSFDSSNNKLIIESIVGTLPTIEEIITMIATKGMQATVWSDTPIDTPTVSVGAANKLIFKVGGVCCGSEVPILKDILRPLLNTDEREAELIFDLSSKKLTIESKRGRLPDVDEIIRVIATKHMQATLWDGRNIQEPVRQPAVSRIEIPPASSVPMDQSHRLYFKIEGMCCAAEVDPLKSALYPILKMNGEDAELIFDIINGKLIVESKSGALPNVDAVVRAVESTGMQASLWSEHVTRVQEKKTLWQKYGHIGLNIASGLSLAGGVAVHAMRDGLNEALGGGMSWEETEAPAYPPLASVAFYSTAIITGSYYILPKAWSAIKRLRPDSHVLMLSAAGGAIGINHWFEAASTMYLFSVAGLIEKWNMERSRNSIRSLMELAPSIARIINEDGTIEEKSIEDIPVGSIIIVKPGEKIPLDSVLTIGETSVNQAPITGESMPIQKDIGDALFAGTINGDSVIHCRVTKLASDSTLASIIRKIEESQSRRAKSEQWIERFSQYYVPSMMGASLIVITIPPIVTGSAWYPWMYKGLQLLVISCPCSLIISTPVSIAASIASAARNGLLVKGGVYLENAAHIEAFAMDKTGTLTTGAPRVQNIIPLNGYDAEQLLRVAVALESNSDHPLARAVQRKAKEMSVSHQPSEDFRVVKGKGGEGYVDGELFWIGSHRFLHEKVGNNEPTEVHTKIQELEASGHSLVAIGSGQTIRGLISIADAVRPESIGAIQALKNENVKNIIMLTGDNAGAAKTIADSIGLDEYLAELLPENKVLEVERLMQKYKGVAMVGDGINDAPAMAACSLGIAMGAAGSDTAIETADIALMSDDLEKLAWLIKHSRHTLNIIKQNVAISLLIKGAFVGLTFTNKSTLWMAMLADMGTSLLVVSNGLRLLNDGNKTTRAEQPQTHSVPKEIKTSLLMTEMQDMAARDERAEVTY